MRSPKWDQHMVISQKLAKKKNSKEVKKEIEELARPKPAQEQMSGDEIKFRKNIEDYTFTPKIHMYRSDSHEKLKQVKNVDKMVLRMKEGRQIRQQKENALCKGWTACESTNKKKVMKKKKVLGEI